MNTERDKYLTKAMGECWHEGVGIHKYDETCSCGQYSTDDCENIIFSTWEGFGKLFMWAKKQDWFRSFLDYNGHGYCIDCSYIEPEIFANEVYNFMQQNGLII